MSQVKYYTLKEVADEAGVTTDVAGAWITSGELQAVNVASSKDAKKPRWRISEIALAAFFEARSTKTTKPAAKRRKRVEKNEIQYV